MKVPAGRLALVLGAAPAPGVASCTPSRSADPEAVVKATFDAINAGEADKAADYFAEDAEWISAYRQSTGVQAVREMLRLTTIPTKTKLEIKELTADGPTVTGVFTMQSSVNPDGLVLQVFATVVNGKIKFMAWTAR